jgi:hypothetical protein
MIIAIIVLFIFVIGILYYFIEVDNNMAEIEGLYKKIEKQVKENNNDIEDIEQQLCTAEMEIQALWQMPPDYLAEVLRVLSLGPLPDIIYFKNGSITIKDKEIIIEEEGNISMKLFRNQAGKVLIALAQWEKLPHLDSFITYYYNIHRKEEE